MNTATDVRSNSGFSPVIRPAWTPVTIALTVLGFMVFWPLGLAMIAYIVWGDRLDAFKTDANRATDALFGSFKRPTPAGFGRSGNVAFDDWRETEMTRLDEERRKLSEMEREFDEYQRELRRAKDREEFEAFLRTRREGGPDA